MSEKTIINKEENEKRFEKIEKKAFFDFLVSKNENLSKETINQLLILFKAKSLKDIIGSIGNNLSIVLDNCFKLDIKNAKDINDSYEEFKEIYNKYLGKELYVNLFDDFLSGKNGEKETHKSIKEKIPILNKKSKSNEKEVKKIENIMGDMKRNEELLFFKEFFPRYKKNGDINEKRVENLLQKYTDSVKEHLPILQRYILTSIKNNIIEPERIEEIIINIKKSYFRLLLIFGSSLSGEILENLLEKKGFDNIESDFNSINGYIKKISESGIDKNYIVLFRRMIAKSYLENNSTFDIKEIKKKFENHFFKSLYKSFNTFKTRYYGYDFENTNNLKEILEFVKKTVGDMKELKESGFFIREDGSSYYLNKNKNVSVIGIIDKARNENNINISKKKKDDIIYDFFIKLLGYSETKEGDIDNQVIENIKNKRTLNFDNDVKDKLIAEVPEEKLNDISPKGRYELYYETKEKYFFDNLSTTLKGLDTNSLDIYNNFLKELGIKEEIFNSYVEKIYKKKYSKMKKAGTYNDNLNEYIEVIKRQFIGTIGRFNDCGKKIAKFKEYESNDVLLLFGLFKHGMKDKYNKLSEEENNIFIAPSSSYEIIKDEIKKLKEKDLKEKNSNKIHYFKEERFHEESSKNTEFDIKLLEFGNNYGYIEGTEDPEFDVEISGKKEKLINFKSLIFPDRKKDLKINIGNHLKKNLNLIEKSKTNSLSDDELMKFEELKKSYNGKYRDVLENGTDKVKIIKLLKYLLFLYDGTGSEKVMGDNQPDGKYEKKNEESQESSFKGMKGILNKGPTGRSFILNDLFKLGEDINCKSNVGDICKAIKNKRNDINDSYLQDTFGDFSTNGVDYSNKLEDGESQIPGLHIGPLKDEDRAFEKLLYQYGGDLGQLTDATRFTVEYDTKKDLYKGFAKFIDAMEKNPDISQISVVDKIEDRYEPAKLPTGYRDIKVLLKKTDGSVIECQFNFHELLKFKINGIEKDDKSLEKQFEKEENQRIKLNEKELKETINLAKNMKGVKLPNIKFMKKYMLEKGIELDGIDNSEFSKKSNVSTDMTYDISRISGLSASVKQKFKKLESILNDIAKGTIDKNEDKKSIN